jgi:hypothetical protein
VTAVAVTVAGVVLKNALTDVTVGSCEAGEAREGVEGAGDRGLYAGAPFAPASLEGTQSKVTYQHEEGVQRGTIISVSGCGMPHGYRVVVAR